VSENVIWGIHVTGPEGDSLHRDKSTLAIGWSNVGDLSKLAPDREAFKAAVQKVFPDKSKGYIINAGSQLFRFTYEMKPDDWVVYRSTYYDGMVYVGRILSGYRYAPDVSKEYPQQRTVKWLGSFSPARVSQGALYELGSALTLFQLRNYGEEFLSALEGKDISSEDADDETIAFVAEDIEQQTAVFVLKKLSRSLKGHGLEANGEDLVKLILEHYDDLEPRYKALIPLKRVFIPQSNPKE
jgi:restriction system protein